MRRTLALLLAMIMALSCCAAAFAEEDIQADLFEAAYEEQEVELGGDEDYVEQPAAEVVIAEDDVADEVFVAGEIVKYGSTGHYALKDEPYAVSQPNGQCGDIIVTYQCAEPGHENITWTVTYSKVGDSFGGYTKMAHTPKTGTGSKITKIPTCKDPGEETVAECKYCGKKNVINVVAATGLHEWGTPVEIVAPSCKNLTGDDYENKIPGTGGQPQVVEVECQICHTKEQRNVPGTEPKYHSPSYYGAPSTAVEPTCFKPGLTGDPTWTCSVCKKVNPDHKAEAAVPATIPSLHDEHVAKLNEMFGDVVYNETVYGEYYDDDDHEWKNNDVIVHRKGDTNIDELEEALKAVNLDITKDGATTLKLKSAGGYAFCEATVTYTAVGCEKNGSLTVKSDCGYEKTWSLTGWQHDYRRVASTTDGSDEPYDCTKGGQWVEQCTICNATRTRYGNKRASHDFENGPMVYVQKLPYRDEQQIEIWPGDNRTLAQVLRDDGWSMYDWAQCYKYTQYKRCAYCEAKKDQKVVPGDESLHVADMDVFEQIAQLKTCTKDGIKRYYCEYCQSPMTVIDPAEGHKWVAADGTTITQVVKAATCTTDGTIRYFCTVCNKGKKTTGDFADAYKDEVLTATGHDWGEWTVSAIGGATCDKAGTEQRVCSKCNEIETRTVAAHHVSTLAANPDTFDPSDKDWVLAYEAPTCTKAGTISYKCTVCHKPVYNEEVPALGHAWERKIQPVTNATFGTSNNYKSDDVVTWYSGTAAKRTAHYMIKDNGKWWNAKQLGDGSYVLDATEPTCTAAGVVKQTCEICGKDIDKKEVGAALGHLIYDKDDVDYKARIVIWKVPTCEEEGIAYYNCCRDNCPLKASDGTIKAGVEIKLDKLPHNERVVYDKKAGKFVKKCAKLTVREANDPGYWLYGYGYDTYRDYAMDTALSTIISKTKLDGNMTIEQAKAYVYNRLELDEILWDRILTPIYGDDTEDQFVPGVGEENASEDFGKDPEYNVVIDEPNGTVTATLKDTKDMLATDIFLYVAWTYESKAGVQSSLYGVLPARNVVRNDDDKVIGFTFNLLNTGVPGSEKIGILVVPTTNEGAKNMNEALAYKMGEPTTWTVK